MKKPEYKGQLAVVTAKMNGLDLDLAEIVQLSIIPVTPELECDSTMKPLNLFIRPTEWLKGGRRANGATLEFIDSSPGIESARQQLYNWWTVSGMPQPFHPIAHKWPRTLNHIVQDFDSAKVQSVFTEHVRDTHVLSHFMNDRHYVHGVSSYPFNRKTVRSLANQLYVDVGPYIPGSAMSEGVLLLKVYRAMLKQMEVPSLHVGPGISHKL